jgi:hypothetical protein
LASTSAHRDTIGVQVTIVRAVSITAGSTASGLKMNSRIVLG